MKQEAAQTPVHKHTRRVPQLPYTDSIQHSSTAVVCTATHHSLSFLSFLLLTCCWMATLLSGRSRLVRAQWIFPPSPIDRKSNCFSSSMTWTGFDASAAAAVAATGAAESLPCFAMVSGFACSLCGWWCVTECQTKLLRRAESDLAAATPLPLTVKLSIHVTPV